jgi:hypothetical protein
MSENKPNQNQPNKFKKKFYHKGHKPFNNNPNNPNNKPNNNPNSDPNRNNQFNKNQPAQNNRPVQQATQPVPRPPDPMRFLNQENKDIIKRMQDSYAKIVDYVYTCSEEQLLWSVNQNKWNIKEIIGHLIQINQLYLLRTKRILNEDKPELDNFDPNAELKKEEFNTRSIEFLLKQFSLSRTELENLFITAPNDLWHRTAMHPERGLITFKTIAEHISTHDASHIEQIFNNLQRHKPWHNPDALNKQNSSTMAN